MKGLLNLAKEHALTSAEEAKGSCFYASLRFAYAATRQGYCVQLVRWELVDDPHFKDHWAVLTEDESVIDVSYKQFSPTSNKVSFDLKHYTRHCINPRIYPSHLLLKDFAPLAHTLQTFIPPSFMIRSAWRIFHHDLLHAAHPHKGYLRCQWTGVKTLLRSLAQATCRYLLGTLFKRQHHLLDRLNSSKFGSL